MPRTDMKININGQMVALPEGFDDYIDWSRAAIVELDMHGGHLDPEPDCPAPSARGRDIIDNVNKFNQACRDLGIPIVHIVNTYRREIDEGKESAWRCITEGHYSLRGEKYVAMTKNFCNLALEDTKWSTLVVENKPGDVVVNTKKRVTAFETTDLDLVMRALGKDVMVITGIMTNCCDLCTAYYAGSKDYKVILCFDMDEPGRKAAQECAMLLTPGKAKIPYLPCKDANECLAKGKTRELISALWDAQPYRPDGIVAGQDLWDKVRQSPPKGYGIPYPQLNDKLHGLRLGELYLFTAGSGIGKSTIVNEIAYHLKMVHGLPLGVIALEESVSGNLRRYLGIHLNKPLHLPEVHESIPEADLKAAFDAVTGDNKWFAYDHFGSSDIDNLLSKLRYMVVGLGCKVIVLDHISIVVSALDEAGGESERKVIDKLMTKLRSLIEETGAMVLAVVHLKRPDKGKSFNEGRQGSLTDLRGSGSLEQVSDVVIALERDQQGDEPNLASIRVLKNRPIGETGPAGAVTYDPETGRLTPADGESFGFNQYNDNQEQQEF